MDSIGGGGAYAKTALENYFTALHFKSASIRVFVLKTL